jgi:hypothetical protein
MAVPATSTSGWQAVGKYGKGLAFDGINDYLSMGLWSGLNITGNFSTTAWFKVTNPSGATSQFIDSRDYSSGNRGWGMAVTSGKLKFEKNGANLLYSTTTLAANTWYHGAVTFDGTNWKLYLNGVLEKTVTGSAILSNTSAQFRVGARHYVGVENYLNGQIDEVRVYNYALTATQVNTVKNATN